MPTYSPKASEIQRRWFVVDAEGVVLGRMATEVARVLRGKHKPMFTPHMDTGDHVIIINADKVVLTSAKSEQKKVYRHSGYPGGLSEQTYADFLATKPADAVRSPCATPSARWTPRFTFRSRRASDSRPT